MVSFAALEEQLFDETGVEVRLRNNIGNGRFMGYNDGNTIEVLAPEAMSRVEGVSDPIAAARYVARHEMGHKYVSDEDPIEHARMDIGVINRLMMIGDYDAASEAVNIHRARARNARGKDREFSKYALEMLGGDGGSELSHFMQRYGGGLGKGEEEGGIVSGFFSRLYKYFVKTYPEFYAPISHPVDNAKGWASNSIRYLVFKGLANVSGSGFVHELTDGVAKTYKGVANEFIRKSSPLARTWVIGYGSGKSDAERVWVYNKGGKKYPIFFSKFGTPTTPGKDPTTAELDEGITEVDTHNESPFNHMTSDVSDDLLNANFKKYGADKYTGNCYKDWFEQEPERVNRWFVKGDTKGSHLWIPDPAAPLNGYKGVVTVFRKDVSRSGLLYDIAKFYGDDKPKSWPMIWANIKGDFAQDIAYVGLGGAFMASFLKGIGVEEPGIRQAMERYFRMGSRIENSLGNSHFFDYE